jgi:SAM-dependent methyltransferase
MHFSKFKHSPIDIVDGIPSFSVSDPYVRNYQKIASDHLTAMNLTSDNPFIENKLWTELEESTRFFINKYVPDGASILDVGVGLGRVLGPIKRLHRFGIDISYDYLRKAQLQGVDVAFSRIEDMPYLDECFDAIVTCDVLEHVIDLHACTKEILRVLKPGGHLIVRVPYKEDLKVYLQEGLAYEYIHLRNFDEYSIKLFFEKIHRCNVLELSTVSPYWQGETRLRYRPPPREAALRLWLESSEFKGLRIDRQGKRILEAITALSEEDLSGWVTRIKQDDPNFFKIISPYLILDIEMNFVVQKPI